MSSEHFPVSDHNSTIDNTEIPASPDKTSFHPSNQKKKRKKVIRTCNDALQQEYSYHRISDHAYLAGLAYQAQFELSSGGTNGNLWSLGTRIDTGGNPEGSMLYHMDKTKKRLDIQKETRPIIGLLGERLLYAVLGEGLSLQQAAERLESNGDYSDSKKGKHLTGLYAWHFRETLEALAAHWKGWHRSAMR